MNIRELVEQARSCRNFDRSAPLTRENLIDLIDCARFCASGANLQPLKYYIASTPVQTAQLQPLTHWAGRLTDCHLPFAGCEPTAFIVICIDRTLIAASEQAAIDVGIAAQTILLAAAEQGWSGCFLGAFQPEEVRKAVHLENTLEPRLMIALGKKHSSEHIRLVSSENTGSVAYFRATDGTHYVPKRPLTEILIES